MSKSTWDSLRRDAVDPVSQHAREEMAKRMLPDSGLTPERLAEWEAIIEAARFAPTLTKEARAWDALGEKVVSELPSLLSDVRSLLQHLDARTRERVSAGGEEEQDVKSLRHALSEVLGQNATAASLLRDARDMNDLMEVDALIGNALSWLESPRVDEAYRIALAQPALTDEQRKHIAGRLAFVLIEKHCPGLVAANRKTHPSYGRYMDDAELAVDTVLAELRSAARGAR